MFDVPQRGDDPPPAPSLLSPFLTDRPLPLVAVELVAYHYPRSGEGEITLWVEHQEGDEPDLRSVSRRPLGPLTCDFDVPDMAGAWIRKVAQITDWPSLIGIARAFRSTAEKARDSRTAP